MEGGHLSEDREAAHHHHETTHLKNLNEHLGFFGIISETFKIFWNNAKVFVVLQLALGLPFYVLSLIASFLTTVWVTQYTKPDENQVGTSLTADFTKQFTKAVGGLTPAVASSLSHPHGLRSVDVDVTSVIGVIAIVIFAVVIEFLLSVAVLVLQSLSVSANIYAVGLLSLGRNISFDSVLKGAIPRLWKRLALTLIYYLLIMLGGSYVIAGLTYFFLTSSLFNSSEWLRIIPVAVIGVVFVVFLYFLGILVFTISGVSVLEDNYGWAAFGVSWKLLGGRKWVAFWIVIFYSALSFIVTSGTKGLQDLDNPWTVTSLLSQIIQILLITFIYQLNNISSAVAYIAFKAHHKEPISSSFILNDSSEGEYEHLPVS